MSEVASVSGAAARSDVLFASPSTGHARERTWRLLVACARHAAGLTDADEVRNTAATVDDWVDVERRASAHGLLPWLARALSQGDDAASDAHASIVDAAGAAAARTLGQVQRLTELVGSLADVGRCRLLVSDAIGTSIAIEWTLNPAVESGVLLSAGGTPSRSKTPRFT